MKAFKELTATEYEIMEVLWEEDEPVSFTWISDFFNNERDKEWKRSTLSTHLLKLSEKGLVKSKNSGRQMYYTVDMTFEEYESSKADNLINKLYNGSVKKLMTALYDGNKISKEEINDLKQWLEDLD